MKKYFTFAMALVSVGVLASCNGRGSEVSKDEFTNKANAIQEPATAYTGATLEYSVAVEVTAPNREGKDETTKQEDKGKIEFTYNDGEFSTKDKLPEQLASYADFVQSSLKDELDELSTIIPEGLDIKYYVAPFGIGFKGELKDPIVMNMDAYVAFNDYGFATKMELKSTTQMEVLSVKTTTKVDAWFNVSYK